MLCRTDNKVHNILANKLKPIQSFHELCRENINLFFSLYVGPAFLERKYFISFLWIIRLVNRKAGKDSRNIKLNMIFLWRCNQRLVEWVLWSLLYVYYLPSIKRKNELTFLRKVFACLFAWCCFVWLNLYLINLLVKEVKWSHGFFMGTSSLIFLCTDINSFTDTSAFNIV